MSKHLSREELVEHLDGTLRADRAAHVGDCDRCRRAGEALAVVLRETRDVEAPEPSPLFWEHFSARVREAIDVPPATAEPRWGAVWGWRRRGVGRVLFAGGVVAAALLAAVQLWRAPQPSPTAIVARDDTATVAPPFEPDPEWALFVTVTDDIDWDTAHEAGLGVRPGAAERAALQLSEQEQIELARLLRAELKRPRS